MEEWKESFYVKNINDAMEDIRSHVNVTGVKINERDLQDLKKTVEQNKVKIGFLTFLILILVVCCGYLCYSDYREKNATETVDSTNRLLIVCLEKDLSASDRSDTAQVRNALRDGGMLRIKPTNSDIEYSFGTSYKDYGATNSSGSFWTTGALLNYISSRGWTFVQAPSSGLTDEYYFIK